MKHYLLIITILYNFSFSFSQESDIVIVDSNEFKIKLRFIDDKYAVFINDWFESEEYGLVEYLKKDDSIFFYTTNDELPVSTTVFYYYNENVGDELLMLQSIFLHQYQDGHEIPSGLEYETPFGRVSPLDTTDYTSTAIIPIKRKTFPLIIHRTLSKDTLEIDLPENTNHVKIKFKHMLTILFPYSELCSSFPVKKTIDGNEYVLLMDLKCY